MLFVDFYGSNIKAQVRIRNKLSHVFETMEGPTQGDQGNESVRGIAQ